MKRKILVLLAICLFAVPAVAQQADSITVTPNELAERIIQEAKKHLGKPYRWAANGPSAFDCSGFTKYVYKQFGYNIPRTANHQGEQLRPVLGDMTSLQKGDLILFGNHWNNKTIGHVGIFIELTEDGRDFLFIHSAHGGVQISHLSEQYYLERFKGAVRVIPDFIDMEMPSGEPMKADAYNGLCAPQLDTLKLGENDRRIIMFGDGKWAYIEADGSVVTPDQSDRIVLGSDGSWFILRGSGVRIPSIIESNEAAHAYEAGVTSGTSTDSGPVYYTVKSGDSLGKIATKYHTTVSALCRLNNMKATDVLKIGRRLRVK